MHALPTQTRPSLSHSGARREGARPSAPSDGCRCCITTPTSRATARNVQAHATNSDPSTSQPCTPHPPPHDWKTLTASRLAGRSYRKSVCHAPSSSPSPSLEGPAGSPSLAASVAATTLLALAQMMQPAVAAAEEAGAAATAAAVAAGGAPVDAAAEEAAAKVAAALAAGTYVPSDLGSPGWEIWAGFVAGVIPFAIGSWEFGKRIIIQQRCQVCSGKGLVPSNKEGAKYLRKCPQCGGFFPWVSWKLFLTSTAAPGNGGPLQFPKGQTGIFYDVSKTSPLPEAPMSATPSAAASTTAQGTTPQGQASEGGAKGPEGAAVSASASSLRSGSE